MRYTKRIAEPFARLSRRIGIVTSQRDWWRRVTSLTIPERAVKARNRHGKRTFVEAVYGGFASIRSQCMKLRRSTSVINDAPVYRRRLVPGRDWEICNAAWIPRPGQKLRLWGGGGGGGAETNFAAATSTSSWPKCKFRDEQAGWPVSKRITGFLDVSWMAL